MDDVFRTACFFPIAKHKTWDDKPCMETFDVWWLCGITFQDCHSDPWRNDNIHEGAKVFPQLVLYYGRFRKAPSQEHVFDVCNTIKLLRIQHSASVYSKSRTVLDLKSSMNRITAFYLLKSVCPLLRLNNTPQILPFPVTFYKW